MGWCGAGDTCSAGMCGGREVQLVWLKGKYIICFLGQKRVILEGQMELVQALNETVRN